MTVKHLYEYLYGAPTDTSYLKKILWRKQEFVVVTADIQSFMYLLPEGVSLFTFCSSQHSDVMSDVTLAGEAKVLDTILHANSGSRMLEYRTLFLEVQKDAITFRMNFMREVFENRIPWMLRDGTYSLRLPEFLGGTEIFLQRSEFKTAMKSIPRIEAHV